MPKLLAAKFDKPIVVAEGEKFADAANTSLGDIAIFTASAHGAQAADKTDWTPLHGRNVYIWPDADAAGKQYAETVAKLCHQAGAKFVAILEPTLIAGRDVSDGWDVADAIAECENDDAKLSVLRERLISAMQAASEWQFYADLRFEYNYRETDDTECGIISVLFCTDVPAPSVVLEPTKVSLFSLRSREALLQKAEEKWAEKSREWGLSDLVIKTLGERLQYEMKRELELRAQEANIRAISQTQGKSETPRIVRTVEPWPEPVALADVLDDIVQLLRRYVVFEQDSDALIVALWLALTYCFDKFKHLPLLIITSAVKRSGKSTLLELVGHLSQRALFATFATRCSAISSRRAVSVNASLR